MTANTPFVYHGTSQPITGDSLIPSTQSPIRGTNEHPSVIYASENPKSPYMYALRTKDTLIGDAIGDQPYIVINKSSSAFEREFKNKGGGRIYKFPSAFFQMSMPVTSGSGIGEWVRDKPLALAAAVSIIKVPDVNTALKNGVSVYYLNNPLKAEIVGHAFLEAMQQDGKEQINARSQLIDKFLKDGTLQCAVIQEEKDTTPQTWVERVLTSLLPDSIFPGSNHSAPSRTRP